jgi:hypothetical protein
MSERLGFRSCPQAPSAFIKLRFQRAIFGSNHLDRSIILHAQTLSNPTAEVNENDSLFIYDSKALAIRESPGISVDARQAVVERPPVLAGGHLVTASKRG